MLFAEFAILFNLNTVRIVLFVFVGLIISLLAFCAGQSNQHAHSCHLFRTIKYSKLNCHLMIIPQLLFSVNKFTDFHQDINVKKKLMHSFLHERVIKIGGGTRI